MNKPSVSPNDLVEWPDMSAYGIHFGMVDVPDGDGKTINKRMVMVDENAAWGTLARELGFIQSRWYGIYVKADTKLKIPGFGGPTFPLAKRIKVSVRDLRERIKPLIYQRRDMRLSQMQEGRNRLSWHPHRLSQTAIATATAQAVPEAAQEAVEHVDPAITLRQTTLLGLNSSGQEVYEGGDGFRFVKANDVIISREADLKNPAAYLRASTPDELVQVAGGMVLEIASGRRLLSDDFIRFMDAVHGVGSTESRELVSEFHEALDKAMLNKVAAIDGAGQDAFKEALTLHEGRPSFWRAPGTWGTPLPIAAVMQSLVQSQLLMNSTGRAPTIIDITNKPGSHSWAFNAQTVDAASIPEHDIALAGVFGQATAAQSLGGVRITRTDTEALLSSLEKRSAEGLTVFIASTDKAGRLDPEFRRALSAMGQRYEVAGLIDLDPSLIGPGSTVGSRLVVVGRKRLAPDYTFSVPAVVPVLFDYEALWNWGETLRAAQLGQSETFGEDSRDDNRWQAPYIPASQVSEPEAMSPRNLLGPVRKALANIVERNGMGIDEFVAHKLGWTMEELAHRLSSEQIDGVAVAIQAIDDSAGSVLADATGLGKGRELAAAALYCKKAGKRLIFLTLNTDLFVDFYRDVADIGAMEQLGKPFIVNNDIILRNPETNVEFARSPKAEVSSMIFACGEFPAGYDLVMATYSQWNRKYEAELAPIHTAIARGVRALIAGERSPFELLQSLKAELELPDYAAMGLHDAAAIAAYEHAQSTAFKAAGKTILANPHEQRAALFDANAGALVDLLSARIKCGLATLKHQWLYSGALNGTVPFLDEAHVAAGDSSQTGVNLQFLVGNAEAVTYSSATFAKDVRNFGLFSRLFPETLRSGTIGATLARGGEPMQEVVSGMLAEDGRLIRREHDLSNLEFLLSVDDGRKERNETWAAGFAQVLSAMSYISGEVKEIVLGINDKADAAIEAAKKSKKGADDVETVRVQYTNFSSKFYALSRTFMMSVNADLSADLAIEALRQGRKPVITVENTMESVLREMVQGVQLDDAKAANDDSADGEYNLGRSVSFRDILRAYVDTLFKATEHKATGKKIVSTVSIDLGTPELRAAIIEVHKLIDSMPEVPLSPLDLVRKKISDAGFSVDEISGRRLSLRANPDGTHTVVRMPPRKKQVLKHAFNSGTLDALILSRSGSTGISLHASRTFADQSQRELIELQASADIAERLQFWGRVNRKGQVCWPRIRMVSSGLPAEMRLITMLNAKLRRLSANITGNADNSGLNEDAPDILNQTGNEVAFRWMEANPQLSSKIGFSVGEILEEEAKFGNTKFVDLLTGRLLMLHPDEQRRAYKELVAEFNAVIEGYALAGVNPLKSSERDLRARKSATEVLQFASVGTSVFNASVLATELTYDVKLPALDRSAAEAEASKGHADLIAQFGPDYQDAIGQACFSKMQAALPALLPKRYPSVHLALVDAKSNAVRNAHTKFSWVKDKLPMLMPGSVIEFVESEGADAGDESRWENLYITGWKVPEENLLSMAEFKVTAYSARTRKSVELALSSLFTRKYLRAFASHLNRAKARDSFFENCAQPYDSVDTRVILEGNLYRAAEIAATSRQGSTVTYTDERGVWRHAIMMPSHITMENVMHTPVGIDSLATLKAVVATASKTNYIHITDDLDTGDKHKASYRLYAGDRGITLALYGGAERSGWLSSNKSLLECMVGKTFAGRRGYCEAKVTPGMEDKFLKIVFDATNACSRPMTMGGHLRAWYNSYLQDLSEAANPQAAVQAALATKDEDDLSALLATP